ncbi:hypothetical protein ARMGADRAFT_146810 [Armillaria gallica]|uniref:Uncharacterized protein n=1 Tax=Armillaria gallica TaxID=47427 RepID=A0A2H3DH02_ARMGA|nr:hypothetical protein ARMGADRAFT_146810 [Armillaria gallica]
MLYRYLLTSQAEASQAFVHKRNPGIHTANPHSARRISTTTSSSWHETDGERPMTRSMDQ